MARLICAALIITIAGCDNAESDEDKLRRLRGAEASAAIWELSAQRTADSIAASVIDSMLDAGEYARFIDTTNTYTQEEAGRLARSLRANQMESLDDKLLWLVTEDLRPDLKAAVDSFYSARDRHTLASRDLNVFMSGR